MKLKVLLESSLEGSYTVYAPGLPGCIREGDTKEEALANILEAIGLFLKPIENNFKVGPKAELAEITL